MKILKATIIVILSLAGLTQTYGQYFTRLGISLDIKTSANIPVTVVDPNAPGFSGQLLAMKFPGRNIPTDPINLVYPLMPGAIDTAAILWYLKPEEISAVPGELNVIVVAIMPDKGMKFFVDNNNDRFFSSSETSFIFRSNEKSRAVNIMVAGSYYPYTLMNPNYSEPVKPAELIGSSKKSWMSALGKPSFAIDLSASFFRGDASLSYIKSTRPTNTITYLTEIPGSFRPILGLDFSWHRIHLILQGGYERIEYTDNIIISTDGDNQTTYYNRGTWPNAKASASVSLEYDISTGKYLFLTPYCAFSVFHYDTRHDFESRQSIPGDKEYTQAHSTEYGAKIKLPAAPSVIIYVNLSYTTVYFNAEKYFHDLESGSYRMHQDGFYYGVGFNFRLTGRR